MEQSEIIIYTDGGAIGNPGPAAIGIIIKQQTSKIKKQAISLPLAGFDNSPSEKKYSEYIGETTNNQAEYQALIFALKKTKSIIGKKKSKDSKVKCFSDSQLLVNQLNGEYKILDKGLQSLFIEVWNLKQEFKNISFNYIPREENKEADKLVKEEFKKQNIL